MHVKPKGDNLYYISYFQNTTAISLNHTYQNCFSALK